MRLVISEPTQVILDQKGVIRIVVESQQGSFGILPARRDCVACLVPGVLLFETDGGEQFVAVDEGLLVKTGDEVTVSVRNGAVARELGTVHEIVKGQLSALSEQEAKLRSLLAKLEGDFVRQLMEFTTHGK